MTLQSNLHKIVDDIKTSVIDQVIGNGFVDEESHQELLERLDIEFNAIRVRIDRAVSDVHQGTAIDDNRAIVWVLNKDEVTSFDCKTPSTEDLEEIAEDAFPSDCWLEIVNGVLDFDRYKHLKLNSDDEDDEGSEYEWQL